MSYANDSFASRAEAFHVVPFARFDRATGDMTDDELREVARVLASLPYTDAIGKQLADIRREQHARRVLDAGHVPQIVSDAR